MLGEKSSGKFADIDLDHRRMLLDWSQGQKNGKLYFFSGKQGSSRFEKAQGVAMHNNRLVIDVEE